MRDYYLSEGATTPLVLNYIDNGLLTWIEGDRHRRIRAVLERAFSLRSVDKQRETMREFANRMAGRLLHAGTVNFVADFTYWYPNEGWPGSSLSPSPTCHGSSRRARR